jgi:hypothetical protein
MRAPHRPNSLPAVQPAHPMRAALDSDCDLQTNWNPRHGLFAKLVAAGSLDRIPGSVVSGAAARSRITTFLRTARLLVVCAALAAVAIWFGENYLPPQLGTERGAFWLRGQSPWAPDNGRCRQCGSVLVPRASMRCRPAGTASCVTCRTGTSRCRKPPRSRSGSGSSGQALGVLVFSRLPVVAPDGRLTTGGKREHGIPRGHHDRGELRSCRTV